MKKAKRVIGRLRVDSNKEKLAEAVETAHLYKVACDTYREKKNTISDPIEKAEARVNYEADHAEMHSNLRKITKFGLLLGYTEDEINLIKDTVFWGPEGKPEVRDIRFLEELQNDFN